MPSKMNNGFRIYGLLMGFSVCLISILWILLQVYATAYTPKDQYELLNNRFQGIFFCLFAMTSGICLILGINKESVHWLISWLTCLIIYVLEIFLWFLQTEFIVNKTERDIGPKLAGLIATTIYFCSSVPIWVLIKDLIDNSHGKREKTKSTA